MANKGIPKAQLKRDAWKQRFADIRAYEDYLAHNGIAIRKFFLHVSRKEQRERLLGRLDRPDKNWKFNAQDVHEREYWNDYVHAYEEMVRQHLNARVAVVRRAGRQEVVYAPCRGG